MIIDTRGQKAHACVDIGRAFRILVIRNNLPILWAGLELFVAVGTNLTAAKGQLYVIWVREMTVDFEMEDALRAELVYHQRRDHPAEWAVANCSDRLTLEERVTYIESSLQHHGVNHKLGLAHLRSVARRKSCFTLEQGLLQTRATCKDRGGWAFMLTTSPSTEPWSCNGQNYPKYTSAFWAVVHSEHQRGHAKPTSLRLHVTGMGFWHQKIKNICHIVYGACPRCIPGEKPQDKIATGIRSEVISQVGVTLFIDWCDFGEQESPQSMNGGHRYLFTANDGRSGFPYIYTSNSNTAEESAFFTYEIVRISKDRYPEIRADNGCHFRTEYATHLNQLYKKLELKPPKIGYAPAYRPQSQSVVEGPHREINRRLRIRLLPKPRQGGSYTWEHNSENWVLRFNKNEVEEKEPDSDVEEEHQTTHWTDHVDAVLHEIVATPLESLGGATTMEAHAGRTAVDDATNKWIEDPLRCVINDVGLMAARRRAAGQHKDLQRQDRNKKNHEESLGKVTNTLVQGMVCLKVSHKRKKLQMPLSGVIYIIVLASTASAKIERLDGRPMSAGAIPWLHQSELKILSWTSGQITAYLWHQLGTSENVIHRLKFVRDITLKGRGQEPLVKYRFLKDEASWNPSFRNLAWEPSHTKDYHWRSGPSEQELSERLRKLCDIETTLPTFVPIRNLIIICWNIDGLKSLIKGPRITMLYDTINKHEPKVVLLQETKVSLKTQTKLLPTLELALPQFEWHFNNSTVSIGYSGTAVGIHRSLKADVQPVTIRLDHLSDTEGKIEERCPSLEGRLQKITMQCDSRPLTLYNLYNVNSMMELKRLPTRLKWDKAVAKELSSHNTSVACIGDLNALKDFSAQSIHKVHLKGSEDIPSLTKEEQSSLNENFNSTPLSTVSPPDHTFHPGSWDVKHHCGFTLDHLIHNSMTRVISIETINIPVRDHRPIKAVITTTPLN